ncbi:transcriptional regulator protein FixT [Mesorhizobium sp. L-8-10]|uniref:hypothetical protein n=1 Tax=Mesorhizobium sp. L-8-3 TaxID=2744522 RepID=UPI0019259595|nr:hypothetical protein [Mesorhizobium sp. L-8-3]BCH24224.1 transcriptional regulator protein FixT [Mesorhizobium sp. L-8-3]BCH31958.1 transcriptional regulator protein FixT [Mesorhizobium sp. L-8-10]
MARSEIVITAAPDDGLRRSLEFALESSGFRVDAHSYATDAFASRYARRAACAVIDDRAVDWKIAPGQFLIFARPVILLVSLFRAAPELQKVTLVTKPFLGGPLIEAVRNAITAAD